MNEWRAAVELCETEQALNQTREALYKRGQDPDNKIIAAIRYRRSDIRFRAGPGFTAGLGYWPGGVSDYNDKEVDPNNFRNLKSTYW